MTEIPHEQRFFFRDGTVAKDVAELKNKIEALSYDEFYSHVNSEKNDFANWVEHVVKDHELAAKLRSVGSIVETVEILNEEANPSETEYHEAELQEHLIPDLQLEIEQKIFGDYAPPTGDVAESVPEVEEQRPSATPTVTSEPAHVPITRVVDDKIAQRKEEMLRTHAAQFVWGLLLGAIMGFILGVIVKSIM